ncbi:hypothetical protein ACVIN2_002891 [Bradyrhizobium sp. USDA 3650]
MKILLSDGVAIVLVSSKIFVKNAEDLWREEVTVSFWGCSPAHAPAASRGYRAQLQVGRDEFVCEFVEQLDRLEREVALADEFSHDLQLESNPVLEVLNARLENNLLRFIGSGDGVQKLAIRSSFVGRTW